MPSRVGPQASSRLQKISNELRTAERKAVNGAAFGVKKILTAELKRDVPSGRLRNVGKSGARLGVRYDVKGVQSPTALVRATGPWHLIENPIKAHDVKPKRRRGANRKKALRTPFGPKASVHHPGVSRPKRTWRRGLPKAQREATRSMRRAYQDAWRRGTK